MLRTAAPPSLARRAAIEVRIDGCRAARPPPPRPCRPAEAKLAAALAAKGYSLAYLKKRAGISDAAAVAGPPGGQRLAPGEDGRQEAVRRTARRPATRRPSSDWDWISGSTRPTADAIRILTADLAAPGFAPFLLVGPAARRTAAILAVCGDVLAGGRSVLVLFPEIGMSRAVADAFAARLGERVVILHGADERPGRGSRPGAGSKRRSPRRRGRPAFGRSSSRLPNLGLIVVDEESDESYLQTESPAYDARTGAWMRAEAAGVRLVLAAEAPRVETYERARRGGWLVEIAGPAAPSGRDRGRPRHSAGFWPAASRTGSGPPSRPAGASWSSPGARAMPRSSSARAAATSRPAAAAARP